MTEEKYQSNFVQSVLQQADLSDHELSLNLQIAPIGSLSLMEVMDIYKNDYKFRMLETMRSNFESLWMFLGDQKFEQVALRYINKYPSIEFDLNLYGKFMHEFLLQKGKANDLPLDYSNIAVELVSFEKNHDEVFHCPTIRNRISKNEITQEMFLNSKLKKSESLKLVSYENNVHMLFSYREKTFADFLESNSMDQVTTQTNYLIFKNDQRVVCKELNFEEFNFFSDLLNNDKMIFESLENFKDSPPKLIEELFAFMGKELFDYIDFK